MKVILLKDVPKLGRKYEVKEVADGHVRNFLLPKGLVKEATSEALEWLELQKEIWQAKDEEALKKAYKAIEKISFEGMQYRKDIGQKALALKNNLLAKNF